MAVMLNTYDIVLLFNDGHMRVKCVFFPPYYTGLI
jgi:hypothetical protein